MSKPFLRIALLALPLFAIGCHFDDDDDDDGLSGGDMNLFEQIAGQDANSEPTDLPENQGNGDLTDLFGDPNDEPVDIAEGESLDDVVSGLR